MKCVHYVCSLKYNLMDTSDFHTKCTYKKYTHAPSCLDEFVPKFAVKNDNDQLSRGNLIFWLCLECNVLIRCGQARGSRGCCTPENFQGVRRNLAKILLC